jgi:indole-3-glycerol phosphate synthase
LDILERIFDQKRQDVAEHKSRIPLNMVKSLAADAPQARGFRAALESSAHRPALIAEVKKASPSKGVIRADFDAVAIAKSYESAGADCLSVLTDAQFFQGSPRDLTLCREATSLPILRKDFTVDEYDVWQARALGADAVLLIVAGLSASQLREYRELAQFLGMDAIVEAHDKKEADRAVASGATMVGINNRDLKTFETNIENSLKLLPGVAKKAMAIGESAIETCEDVEKLGKAGARAVLIGTAFCSAPDIESKVKEVMGW